MHVLIGLETDLRKKMGIDLSLANTTVEEVIDYAMELLDLHGDWNEIHRECNLRRIQVIDDCFRDNNPDATKAYAYTAMRCSLEHYFDGRYARAANCCLTVFSWAKLTRRDIEARFLADDRAPRCESRGP